MKTFYVGIKGVVRDQARGIILLHRDYQSGDFWDTPGGRIDGDEEFEDTLRRELQEELPGIADIKIGKLLGAFRVQKDIDRDIGLVLLYFLVDASLPEEIQISEEHKNYTWVNSVEAMPSNGLNVQIKQILKECLALGA